jgi:HAD superfamily hydrolase (TIGR01509 family)
MTHLTLVLDDGDVLNDNALRGRQWQQLVGEFFAPRLGGTPAAWAEANRLVSARLLESTAWQARLRSATDYASFDRAYQIDWLHGMCTLLALPAPPEEESVALANRTGAWVIGQVRAALPGAVEAIRTLHTRGYVLHTASGACSADLAGYLEGMGVRDCFGQLYGPDLLGVFKDGPRFYARVFADAGVAAADALVVDDNPQVTGWAAQVGAQTVLVRRGTAPTGRYDHHLPSLAELPALVARLEAGR